MFLLDSLTLSTKALQECRGKHDLLTSMSTQADAQVVAVLVRIVSRCSF